MEINKDYIIKDEFMYDWNNEKNFTLTVKAVNDAPILLQLIEVFEILEPSKAAAMVQI